MQSVFCPKFTRLRPVVLIYQCWKTAWLSAWSFLSLFASRKNLHRFLSVR